MYVKFVVKVTLPAPGTPEHDGILADMEAMLIEHDDSEMAMTGFVAHRCLMGEYAEYAKLGRTLVSNDGVGYVE